MSEQGEHTIWSVIEYLQREYPLIGTRARVQEGRRRLGEIAERQETEQRISANHTAELEEKLANWGRGLDCSHCLRCSEDGLCNFGFSPMYVPLICNCYRPDGTWQHPVRKQAEQGE